MYVHFKFIHFILYLVLFLSVCVLLPETAHLALECADVILSLIFVLGDRRTGHRSHILFCLDRQTKLEVFSPLDQQ